MAERMEFWEREGLTPPGIIANFTRWSILTEQERKTMAQFIGFLIDGNNPDRSTPIAVGSTREECLGIAAQRALANVMLNDSIGVQQRDEVPADVFAKLGEVLAAHFGPDHC